MNGGGAVKISYDDGTEEETKFPVDDTIILRRACRSKYINMSNHQHVYNHVHLQMYYPGYQRKVVNHDDHHQQNTTGS